MAVDVLRVADRVAGTAIERLTSAHHARRLGKLGRSAQRRPPDDGRLWAAGDPPPRAGNALEVLIEGAAYFPALEQAIRCARRSVSIAGWCITPGFALARDEPPVLLRELLREAADCRRSILEEPARRTFRPPGLGDLRSQIVLLARSSRPHNGMPPAIGFTRQARRCERHNGNHRLQSRGLKPRAVMSVTPPTVSPASAPGSVLRTSQTSPSGAVWRSSNICSRARSTDQASYFLSRVTIAPTDAARMSRWRKKRFLTMAHNAANPTRYLDSPTIAP